jgi:hypothetical protein
MSPGLPAGGTGRKARCATTHRPARHLPPLHIDADAINARLTGLARARKCKKCTLPASQAITDITSLLIQVTSLHQALTAARLDAANLRAAIYAALGAAEDGESDPLAYLRDEFPEPPDQPFPGPGGWCL